MWVLFFIPLKKREKTYSKMFNQFVVRRQGKEKLKMYMKRRCSMCFIFILGYMSIVPILCMNAFLDFRLCQFLFNEYILGFQFFIIVWFSSYPHFLLFTHSFHTYFILQKKGTNILDKSIECAIIIEEKSSWMRYMLVLLLIRYLHMYKNLSPFYSDNSISINKC